MALTEFFFTGAIGILAAFISATFFSILGGSWAFEIEAQIPLLRFTAFGLALLFAICLVSWFAFSFSARRER